MIATLAIIFGVATLWNFIKALKKGEIRPGMWNDIKKVREDDKFEVPSWMVSLFYLALFVIFAIIIGLIVLIF